MNVEMVVTDLTRMQGGYVCVAGQTLDGGVTLRLAHPRVKEADVLHGRQARAYPSAVVAVDIRRPDPRPPHTEDCVYAADSLRHLRRLNGADWEAALRQALFQSVEAVFEQPIEHDQGYHVADGAGPRSLGTVEPAGIEEVLYGPDSYAAGAWDYRLRFVDGAGQAYRFKITDLSWQYYCHSQRGADVEPADVAAALTERLRAAETRVYLRLGLSRGWAKWPDRCFLQVNGVYTFPDYLDGKTFAYFAHPA